MLKVGTGCSGVRVFRYAPPSDGSAEHDEQNGRLPIAQPVADNEWLRGYETPVSPQNGLRDCYAVAGVRYNNILMVAQVDNDNSVTPPGDVTCQTSYKWSTRVLAALYTRAQRYALHQ